MKKLFVSLSVFCCYFANYAQEYFPKNDGIKTSDANYTVFTNATVHTAPGNTIENGTLVIRKGKIDQVGRSVKIPKNSIVVDLKGKHIYPSFIDPYTNFGIKKPKSTSKSIYSSNAQPQWKASREGYYWNDHIRPETNALDHFKYDKKKADLYLKQGFGTVHTHMPDGIIRGTGALVALNHYGSAGERLLSDRSAQFLSFKKSGYSTGKADQRDLALEAINKNKNLPQIFEAESRINGFRASKVAKDAGVQYIIVGGGDEYARMDNVKATNAKYIIPLNFPDAYDVTDPYAECLVSLGDMRHWNQAPTNPMALAKNGISFSFTTHKLKKIDDFSKQIAKAMANGLSKEKALEAKE